MTDKTKTGPRLVDSTRAGNQGDRERPWWGGWGMVATTAITAGIFTLTGILITRAVERAQRRLAPAPPPAPVAPQVVVIREDGDGGGGGRLPHPMSGDWDGRSSRSERDGGGSSRLDEDLRKKIEQQDKQLRTLKRRLDELEEG